MEMKNMIRKLSKQTHAVSPVIATLMLVLVSVGSAGAFYVWQSGWQGEITLGVGDNDQLDSSRTITIGGSSTVYEFEKAAKYWFLAQEGNDGYTINIQSGGSTSGIMGAGLGLVDIGAASKNIPSSLAAQYPDLDGDGSKDENQPDLVAHLLGYDGIVMIISSASGNPGLTNITKSEVANIYNGTYTHWDDLTNATTTTEINVYDRADSSGTEASFRKFFFGTEADLDDVDGAGVDEGVAGNQDLITTLAADPDGISFMAYGIAASSSGITVLDTDFEEGEGVEACSFDAIASGDWDAGRPLNFITVGEPTGLAATFINFCLQSYWNQKICEDSAYVSIYW